jgi:hypothetical protein
VANAMGYESPHWLFATENYSHQIHPSALPLLQLAKDYLYLASLLHLDEEALYHLTLHRFISRLPAHNPLPEDVFAPIRQAFLAELEARGEREQYVPKRIHYPLMDPLTAKTYFLSPQSLQVCPYCLESQEEYGYLYWRCRFLPVCPQHRVFLVNACPVCHAPVAPLRTSRMTCPSCHRGDYRAVSHSYPVPSFFLAASWLTLRALGVEQVSSSLSPLNSPVSVLDGLTPPLYFFLLHTFCKVMNRFSADFHCTWMDRHLYEQLPVSGSELAASSWRIRLMITHFLFTSWPDHFFAFLDGLHMVLLYYGESLEAYCVSLFFQTFKDEAFSFLRQAYQQYQENDAKEGYRGLCQRVQERLNVYGIASHLDLRPV